MGRKIPGKKHRTVKDPYKQIQQRLDSIRFKVNNPPPDSNAQEIPKSLLRVMELKTKASKTIMKNPKKKLKKPEGISRAKASVKEGPKRPDNFISKLVQKPNEPTKVFLRKLDTFTQNLINEVEYEKKFGVEIKRDSQTGKVIEVKKVKRKSNSKKKKLSEKRKAKLNEKKENLKTVKDFSQLKDNVEFGEVVHRPPDFSKIKTNGKKNEKSRYSNLFLNSIIKKGDTDNKNAQKHLESERKERERKFVIEAYRKIKRRKTE